MQIMTFEGPTWCKMKQNIFSQIEYWNLESGNKMFCIVTKKELGCTPIWVNFWPSFITGGEPPPACNRLQLIMPNVFPAPPNLTLRIRVGRYMTDKLYLLSPVITPLEKENEDNFGCGEGGRGCQYNVWCGKLFKLTNRKLLPKSCAQNQSPELAFKSVDRRIRNPYEESIGKWAS